MSLRESSWPIQPTHCQEAPSSTGTACNWEARLLDSRSSHKRSNQTQRNARHSELQFLVKKKCWIIAACCRPHSNCFRLCHPKPFQSLLVVREPHIPHIVVVGPTYTLFIRILRNIPRLSLVFWVPNHARPAQLYTCQGALSSDGTACTCNWEARRLDSRSLHKTSYKSIISHLSTKRTH